MNDLTQRLRVELVSANKHGDPDLANLMRDTLDAMAHLRLEVAAQRTRADAMAGEAIKHEARAERLAEALRVLADAFESRMADEENPDWNECWNNAHALLRELEEGK